MENFEREKLCEKSFRVFLFLLLHCHAKEKRQVHSVLFRPQGKKIPLIFCKPLTSIFILNIYSFLNKFIGFEFQNDVSDLFLLFC